MTKTMKKIPAVLLATVIAVAFAFAVGTVTTQEAYAEEQHTHDGVTFEPWQSEKSLPYPGGNYYLTKDVTISAWSVDNDISLCLNGHSITINNEGGHIKITSVLNLYDCGTTGKITHASGLAGSGIHVFSGTLNMYGGTISGNHAEADTGDGGGVTIHDSGTFNMYGGTICDNSAEYGGGISQVAGTFNMYGGLITGNSATAGGGGVDAPSTIRLSGTPVITGNTVNGEPNNLTATAITISDALSTPEDTTGPQIGVTMQSPGVFTSGLSGKLPADKTADDIFFSDDPAFGVTATGENEARLGRLVGMKGEGTVDSPYQITSYEDLKEFASIVNGTNDMIVHNTAACGKLMNDITCDDKVWVPIGNSSNKYTGHFDGDHKVIRNLSNEETGGRNVQGLVGSLYGGEVKDVGIVGGKIMGTRYVGGLVGINNGGTITNCYNTGTVNGTEDNVGGVVGTIDKGTVTNCYNTGAVSGTGDYVGGVAGVNAGTMTNCYNTGAVSGNSTVGGVVGYNLSTLNNCYFDNTFSVVFNAVGSGPAGEIVKGLATDQMIGTTALDKGNMVFSYTGSEQSPWIVNANGKDENSGTYYSYYPHLKGFAYDSTKSAADWPGKLTTSVDWRDVEASYPYNGSPQGPTVNKVTMSQKPVKDPSGMTAEWRSKTVDESSGDPMWSNPPVYDEPSLPGVYKLTIKDPKDGDKVIEEIVYIILKKKNSSYSNDYNVKYQVQKKTAGGGTEWSDFGSSKPVDGGKYKEVVTLADGTILDEKGFRIVRSLTITTAPTASAITYGKKLNDSKLTGGVAKDGDTEVAGTFTWDEPNTVPAVSDSDLTEYDVTFTPDDTVIYDPQPMKVTVPVNKAKLTITAISYRLPYNGEIQGPGDAAYDVAAKIAEVVKVSGLKSGDELASLVIDGQGQKVGTYPLTPSNAVVKSNGNDVTFNYAISYVPGKLTITKPQNSIVAPKAMTAGKNALTIHWRKVSGAQGYDIFFSICGKDTKCKLVKTIKGNKTFSWTKAGLKTKTPYKAYVKGWTMKDGKKKYISTSPTLHLYTANGTNSYTVAKSIKVKKTKVKLKVGKKYKIKAKIIKRDKTKKLMPATHTKQLRYISTNKKIATVSKSGKIKAKAKGNCRIYVYAANGVSKAVKVTVR